MVMNNYGRGESRPFFYSRDLSSRRSAGTVANTVKYLRRPAAV